MELLQKILSGIPSLDSPIVATLVIVCEFLFRLVPTQKPLSILHIGASVLKVCGAILVKAGDLADKILPQNVKPPQA